VRSEQFVWVDNGIITERLYVATLSPRSLITKPCLVDLLRFKASSLNPSITAASRTLHTVHPYVHAHSSNTY
jgi:hypothetical protein